MTRIAIAAAAITAALAAPAVAQDAQAFAVDHFNMSQDSIDNIRMVNPAGGTDVVISTQNRPVLTEVYAEFNDSIDGTDGLRGTTGQVTNYSGTPAYGADIFADLRAASQENE